MTGPLQPDLFGSVHVEAKDLTPGSRVRRSGVETIVTAVEPLDSGGVVVRGRNARHGGLSEFGCSPDTHFEVLP